MKVILPQTQSVHAVLFSKEYKEFGVTSNSAVVCICKTFLYVSLHIACVICYHSYQFNRAPISGIERGKAVVPSASLPQKSSKAPICGLCPALITGNRHTNSVTADICCHNSLPVKILLLYKRIITAKHYVTYIISDDRCYKNKQILE